MALSRKRRRAALIGLALVAITLLVRYELAVRGAPDPDPSAREMAVLRVIDADTILVDLNGDGRADEKTERVQLLGVDARMAAEAKKFTEKQLRGARVRLAIGKRPRDLLDRTLAFVYIVRDGETTLLNEQLIRRGYARLRRDYADELPDDKRRLLIAAETDARDHRRGPLWRAAKPGRGDAFVLPADGSLSEERAVLGVIDGDTIVVDLNGNARRDGKAEEVRLLGVDADELGGSHRARARRATAFVETRAADRRVRLAGGTKRFDRYGRTLAFVYLDLAGRTVCLNEEVIRQGYARFYRRFQSELPPAMRERLLAAEAEAKRSKRGPVWER